MARLTDALNEIGAFRCSNDDCAVCSAPLPDDVADLVARLRGYHICTVTNNEAADMIERLQKNVVQWKSLAEASTQTAATAYSQLARQVPEGMVECMQEAADILAGVRPNRGPIADELHGFSLMISAGEVKP